MPLSDAERDQLKSLIEKRRIQLVAEIQGDVARSRSDSFDAVAGEAPDTGDQALASLVADMDNAETSRDIRELRELDAALQRIAQRTYGVCLECDDDIPFARLLAYLIATRCIRCQSIHEKTHTHPGEPKL